MFLVTRPTILAIPRMQGLLTSPATRRGIELLVYGSQKCMLLDWVDLLIPNEGSQSTEQLAAEGNPAAEHDLGYCYEYGQGVTIDYQKAAQWYGKAAVQRYVPALYNLGTLYAKDRIVPEDDVEGLTLLIESAILSEGEPGEKAKFIRDDTPGHRSRLMARMNVEQIGVAQKQAEERAKEFRLEVNPKGSKKRQPIEGGQ